MTVYYTQLIFVRDGAEPDFLAFEERVLPLLAKYNGRLEYRVRPAPANVVASEIGHPYEVHLVSFESKSDFEAYARDPERQKHLPLKDVAVERAILIQGTGV